MTPNLRPPTPVLRPDGDGVRVRVHLQPRASRDRVEGLFDGAVKVALSAPPVDGRANAALCALIGKLCGVAKGRVAVVAGATSRRKEVLIRGAAVSEIADKLGVDI